MATDEQNRVITMTLGFTIATTRLSQLEVVDFPSILYVAS